MSTEVPLFKKQKLDQKVIGTHNGTFHCDEALAVYMLRHTSAYRDAGLKRSRDQAVLDTCDIVVDVGGIYDESKQRFDHHQRGFAEVFGNGFDTKLSSAGLVYKHFGKEIIASRTQLPIDDPKVETLWLKLYEGFIESIDAIDNGISQYDTDVKPRYKLRTDLSSRVGNVNPAWNEKVDLAGVDALFEKASAMTGVDFTEKLNNYANSWLPARNIVVGSVEKSKAEVDPTGRIIVLSQFAPWKEHLLQYEASVGTTGTALYVLFEDDTAHDWRVNCVPVSLDRFGDRKSLPEAWRGIRDQELSKVSGIDGCIFVHASGFTGGNRTYEGALAMAKAALEM
ncbi:metal-dependent protein hydrolase [Schizophyllum amplum]|uniref:Metal-dependent protein hydrolase n=1 Tax=Schizophyllum amplum TaxID=97359 RepID=A0A550CNN0_9AGAR|nr:metal-dependent protein hydrolase [Auriculariopsis ampla]